MTFATAIMIAFHSPEYSVVFYPLDLHCLNELRFGVIGLARLE